MERCLRLTWRISWWMHCLSTFLEILNKGIRTYSFMLWKVCAVCPLMDFKLYCKYFSVQVIAFVLLCFQKHLDQIECVIVPRSKARRIMCVFVPDNKTLPSLFFFFSWKLVPINSICIFHTICVLILLKAELLNGICSSGSLSHLNSWLIFSEWGLFSCSHVEG